MKDTCGVPGPGAPFPNFKALSREAHGRRKREYMEALMGRKNRSRCQRGVRFVCLFKGNPARRCGAHDEDRHLIRLPSASTFPSRRRHWASCGLHQSAGMAWRKKTNPARRW